VIPPRDEPERDVATDATPAEASPEDDSPAAAARRRHAAVAAARGEGNSAQADPARRISFDDNKSPIDCFNEFFTPEIIQRICNCTNARAKQFRVLLLLAETDLAMHPQIKEALKRPPWIPAKQSWPPECARAWTDLTPPELKRWVGILVYSGVVDLPRWEDYFVTDAMWGPGGGKLGALTMTRKRFDVIKAMLSTETPEEESNAHENGRIRKMGVLLELFGERCKAARP